MVGMPPKPKENPSIGKPSLPKVQKRAINVNSDVWKGIFFFLYIFAEALS